jgi:uncharacterized phage protein (TIGR02220 family)
MAIEKPTLSYREIQEVYFMKCTHCEGTGEMSDPEPIEINYKNACISIIDTLNQATGASFRPNSLKTRKCIMARLNEGFTAEDFATVIRVKCKQWLYDPSMKGFLRPETLFGPKFEGYLNEDVKPPKKEVQLVY